MVASPKDWGNQPLLLLGRFSPLNLFNTVRLTVLLNCQTKSELKRRYSVYKKNEPYKNYIFIALK